MSKNDDALEPVLEVGTKLVPYEERFFRSIGMAARIGYTSDIRRFYSEEQVKKLRAENEAQAALLRKLREHLGRYDPPGAPNCLVHWINEQLGGKDG